MSEAAGGAGRGPGEDEERRGRPRRGRARGRSKKQEEAPGGERGQSPSDLLRAISIRGRSDSPGSEDLRQRYGGGPGSPEGGTGNGGNGHGNGNGNGTRRDRDNGNNGRRASRLDRSQQQAAMFDLVSSRAEGQVKQGTGGKPIGLLANYFEVKRHESWSLFHYHVSFSPEIDSIGLRKGLLKNHQSRFPAYIFDGASMHTAQPLGDDLLELLSISQRDQQQVSISIKLVGQVASSDAMYLQFYNSLCRKCLGLLDLALLGRNFFDPQLSIEMANYNLQIWPGFLTTMRRHEHSLLYCVQVLHKVIRKDNVLQLLQSKRKEFGGQMDRVKEAIRAELIGAIVLNYHSKKTYKVDDISWDERPTHTFPKKDGSSVSFMEYYQSRYNITIQQPGQPLLVSNPTRQDVRRGNTQPVKLIPELCYMTGLSEPMRQNFNLMRAMGEHLFQIPEKKVNTIMKFINRIRSTESVTTELQRWGLQVGGNMVRVPGRQFPPEKVTFRDQKTETNKDFEVNPQNGDFTQAFRNCRLAKAFPLNNWVVILPTRDGQGVDGLINAMQTVSRPLGFEISRPVEIVRLPTPSIDAYINAVNSMLQKYEQDLQLIFTILPNNKVELYAAIKKRCYVEYGIPSQCFLAKNVNNKGLMSVATKLTVQMNCKLGGEAWYIPIPLKNMMIIGFDVYHSAPGTQGGSIGALVSTTSQQFGKYFSTVSVHRSREEISGSMGTELTKCLDAWQRHNNGALPERIMFYRDGVGEGQLQFVFSEELGAIKKVLFETYKKAKLELPKFSFIVVTKRINTRFFAEGRAPGNPLPGTVVDDIVTLPERYDFYLIAQSVRQGTVSPTSYNVLFDKSELDASKIQRLTYKLCHLYYNFSGTVSVPAPCQYAHKLAALTGLATKQRNNEKLSHQLYFL